MLTPQFIHHRKPPFNNTDELKQLGGSNHTQKAEN